MLIYMAGYLVVFVPKPLVLVGVSAQAAVSANPIRWYTSPVVWLMPFLLIVFYFMFFNNGI